MRESSLKFMGGTKRCSPFLFFTLSLKASETTDTDAHGIQAM